MLIGPIGPIDPIGPFSEWGDPKGVLQGTERGGAERGWPVRDPPEFLASSSAATAPSRSSWLFDVGVGIWASELGVGSPRVWERWGRSRGTVEDLAKCFGSGPSARLVTRLWRFSSTRPTHGSSPRMIRTTFPSGIGSIVRFWSFCFFSPVYSCLYFLCYGSHHLYPVCRCS